MERANILDVGRDILGCSKKLYWQNMSWLETRRVLAGKILVRKENSSLHHCEYVDAFFPKRNMYVGGQGSSKGDIGVVQSDSRATK